MTARDRRPGGQAARPGRELLRGGAARIRCPRAARCSVAGRAHEVERRAGTDDRPLIRLAGLDDPRAAARRAAAAWRPSWARTSGSPPTCVGCRVPGHGQVVRVLDGPSCSVLELEDGVLVPFVADAIDASVLEAREIEVERGLPRMKIDVFTLFPAWFDWFREQRHVRNALDARPRARDRRPARHHAAEGRPGRRHALRRRRGHGHPGRRGRGGAARPLRRGARRAHRRIALAPGGRQFDDALAAELAARGGAHAALRPLRGLRRARARAPGHRRGLDRALRAVGRRAGGDGRLRRGAAQAAGRARARGERGRGVVQRGARGRARVPALHAPVDWRGHARARGPAVGRPRAASASGGSSAAASAARL